MILGILMGLAFIISGVLFVNKIFLNDTQEVLVRFILLIFTSLGHLTLGTVNWGLVIPIWIGSVPGVIIGAKLCEITPQRPLKLIIYSILMMVSWKLVLPA